MLALLRLVGVFVVVVVVECERQLVLERPCVVCSFVAEVVE